jgi:hypothetical protein
MLTDAASYTEVVSGTAPCSAVTQIYRPFGKPNSHWYSTKQYKPFVQEHQQSFNVPATGTGLSYQWRKGTTNLTDGGTISGAATATLTINPTVSGDAVRYNVIITELHHAHP